MKYMMEHRNSKTIYSTTILCVRKGKEVVIAGDGQASLGATVVKATANKIRRLGGGEILAGFAGSTADAFKLFQRLEEKLEEHPAQVVSAAVELAQDWRADKYLRRLEAMMIVADKSCILIVTGNGDVLEPEDGIASIGSGGNYALAAARALKDQKMTAEEIVRKSMNIAADICVYTNNHLTVEKL
jgi:ATP-dependent HslUV protease subunit HslV